MRDEVLQNKESVDKYKMSNNELLEKNSELRA